MQLHGQNRKGEEEKFSKVFIWFDFVPERESTRLEYDGTGRYL